MRGERWEVGGGRWEVRGGRNTLDTSRGDIVASERY